MPPPSSQKARNISFVLDAGGSSPASVTLAIRPEDLTRTEQSRATVHQTMGRDVTGWVDDFGPGLPSVVIAGHTGWRAAAGGSDDGVQRFLKLHDQIYKGFHSARQAKIDAGLSPDSVKLLFIDELDRFAYQVIPTSFILKRSKSRPLLMMYNISLQAISDSAEPFSVIPLPSWSELSGIDSLIGTINGITSRINDVRSFVDQKLVAPVRNFMQKTAKLYSSVVTMIRTGAGLADQAIGVARMVSQAGMNIFRTFSAVASIPSLVKAKLIAVANEYSNAFCVLSNALRGRIQSYSDYTQLYGASNCSSTSGGRPISPLSGTNPFYALFPVQPGLPVGMTASAQASVASAAMSDVVLNPMSAAAAGSSIASIASGMSIT